MSWRAVFASNRPARPLFLPGAGQSRPRRRDSLPSGRGDAAASRDRGLAGRRGRRSPRGAPFGNVALAKEDTRAVWVSTTSRAVRSRICGSACRILTKSPGVSLTAIALIALVIGGNTTVFSIAHGVLAKPSPGVHAPRLDDRELGRARTATSKRTPAIRVYTHFLATQHRPFSRSTAFDFARLTLTARQRQLRGPRRHRLAELLRDARRASGRRGGRSAPRKPKPRSSAPRCRSRRASYLAEPPSGGADDIVGRSVARERPAGDGCRRCRGRISRRAGSPSSPISGSR